MSPTLSMDASGNITINSDQTLWGPDVNGSRAIWGASVTNELAILGTSVWEDRAIWGADTSAADLRWTALNGE